MGAVLEQTARTLGMPTIQDAFSGKTIMVAFTSRKLSTLHERIWDIRDKVLGMGAVLEQTARTSGMPTVHDAFSGKALLVAFMSHKLSILHERTWDIRDKETYAVVAALEKWSSWIGLQPVLILTDHKSLESW